MTKNNVALINEFVNWLSADGKSSHTIKNYERVMRELERSLDESVTLSNLTRIDVKTFVNSLQAKGNSASTINVKYAAVVAFAKYINKPAIVQDIDLPTARKTRHIAPKSLERNERNRVLREVERDGNLRDIAIINTLLYTGLRVGELVALNRDDITIGERSGSVTVRQGKGNVSRTVPLPREARLHLSRYLESRGDGDPALFISTHKRRLTVRSVQRMLAKYGTHPHALRHTYARELVAEGVDIATVAEVCGHADINVTRRYAKPSLDDIADQLERAFN